MNGSFTLTCSTLQGGSGFGTGGEDGYFVADQRVQCIPNNCNGSARQTGTATATSATEVQRKYYGYRMAGTTKLGNLTDCSQLNTGDRCAMLVTDCDGQTHEGTNFSLLCNSEAEGGTFEGIPTVAICKRGEVHSNGGCEKCGPGLDCDGTNKTCVMPGFWRSSPASPPGEEVKCPQPSQCLGTMSAPDAAAYLATHSGRRAAVLAESILISVGSDVMCKKGTHGPLCGFCDPGWALTSRGECIECSGSSGLLGGTVLAMIILILFASYVFRPSMIEGHNRLVSIIKVAANYLVALRVTRTSNGIKWGVLQPMFDLSDAIIPNTPMTLICSAPSDFTLREWVILYSLFIPTVIIVNLCFSVAFHLFDARPKTIVAHKAKHAILGADRIAYLGR